MGKQDDKGEVTGHHSPLHLVEKKNFTQARCDCGWVGPGRRSRKKAREDAAAHLGAKCKAFKKQ